MLSNPVFKPHFRVEAVAGEGVFLLSELDQNVVLGRVYEKLAPYLDGRSVEDLCMVLDGHVSAAEVFYALKQLEKKGYLTEASSHLPIAERALWSTQNIDAATAANRLDESSIGVRVIGEVDSKAIHASLRAAGIHPREDGNLTLVATDSYLRPALETWNKSALASERTWLLVKPVGKRIWLGPLFRPGKTACWRCLEKRLRSNSPIAAHLEEKFGTGLSISDPCWTQATLQTAWGMTVTAVTSWIVRGELPHLEGKIQTFDPLTGQMLSHTLVKNPACPDCGLPHPAAQLVTPLIIESRTGNKVHDGGFRAHSAEQTLAQYEHHVSPITGAVSTLVPVDKDGEGVVHVYLSGFNVGARSSWAELRGNLRSLCAGKGTNAAQAKTGALCEALERHSAVFRGNEPRRKARLLDLEDAIHPNACMLFSDKQYQERNVWNDRGSRFNTVPLPFDPHAMMEWTPIWSLTRQKIRYLPTAFCYFRYPSDLDSRSCSACSNGNAAGNSREEAILQGFLELVERDSVALWWYNRIRRPSVDLDSFSEPYLDQLRSFLSKHHRDLWVLDLTSDIGIPVFVAVSKRNDGPTERIIFGFGSHLDARIALLRAVTELNQMLSHLLDFRSGSAPSRVTDKDTTHWLLTASVNTEAYLRSLEGPSRTAFDFPTYASIDLKDDIAFCQQTVERLGMEMLVLDLTRSEIGMPTVKVIVPGLRHFWARFAPGRLYDVPVQMGWLGKAVEESELNPIPMFL